MKHQLDDFIKGKFDQRTFEFKDEYWDAAQNLIAKDELRRKWNKIYSIVGIAALILAVGVGSYYLGLNNSEIDVNLAENAAQIENIDPLEKKKKSIASNELNTIITAETETKTEVNSLDQREFETPVSVNSNSKGNSNGNVKINRNINANEKINTNSGNESRSKNLNNNGSSNVTKNILADFSSKSSENSTTVLNDNEDNTVPRNIENTNSSPLVSISNEASQKPKVEEEYSNLQKLEILSLMNIGLFSENFSTDGLLQVSELEPPSKYNSARKFSLGLKTGALLYFPTKKIGWNAGIQAAYKLNRNLSLGAELNYAVRKAEFEISNQSNSTQYSFGRKDYSYSLKPTEVHSIELPLLLRYSFGSSKNMDLSTRSSDRVLRHTVYSGITPSYLNGVKGQILESVDEAQAETFQSGWTDSEYYNSIGAILNLGYDYNLNKQFAIGLRANYQLNNIYKEEYINQGAKEPNHFFLELQAYYKLF